MGAWGFRRKESRKNKLSILACSFGCWLRCSLVTDHCEYAPRERLASSQNSCAIIAQLICSRLLSFDKVWDTVSGKERQVESQRPQKSPIVSRELYLASLPRRNLQHPVNRQSGPVDDFGTQLDPG